MSGVVLQDVSKSYGDTAVLSNLDLSIPESEFVVIVGPSGCGKSTTLRLIAGLESASAGKILIREREVTHLALCWRLKPPV